MVVAIIVAAGEGKRMGRQRGKQFLPLLGKPLLAHTLQAFQDCPRIDKVIVVTPKERVDFCQGGVVKKYSFSKVMKVTAGGVERQDSVYCGLQQLPSGTSVVVIHDGARPLITPDLLTGSLDALPGWDGVVVAVPAVDTLKELEPDYKINRTVDRQKIYTAQTPQVFPAGVITRAYERAVADGHHGTDDSSLVERAGYRVRIIESSPENIKITTSVDLLVAEAILKSRLKT